MNKLRSVIIALAVFSLFLFGVVNSSEAAKITSLSVYASTDYGSGANIYASLTADEEINYIDWYVKQTYPKSEADSDYEYVYTSMGGTRSVYVPLPKSYDGHIKIAEYKVKAQVWFFDPVMGANFSDIAVTTVDIKKPAHEGGLKETGANGYSHLTAHYFDGSAIIMDGFATVYNGTNKTVKILGRFRHTALNKPLDELEKVLPTATLEKGESAYYNTSGWGGDWGPTYFHFPTTLQGEDEWNCDAYLRINARAGGKEDSWLGHDVNTFNRDDHR